jgi:sorting nexin-9/18/33
LSGLNASAAWTEHLERESLSDEEPDSLDVKEDVRPARALYDFEGKVEFRELVVGAGDELEIIKEELADGWSLVKNGLGQVGLMPRSYYAVSLNLMVLWKLLKNERLPFKFTSDFAEAPGLEHPPLNGLQKSRKPSEGDATPRSASPIVPQNTGEWFALPSFRHRLLGGKSLNRFSSFVASGAEEWILKGSAADVIVTSPSHDKVASDMSELAEEDASRGRNLGMSEADRHFVDIGPSWKSKLPGFRVMVHSPSKRTSKLSGAYIVYAVTSLFHLRSLTDSNEDGETTTDECTPVPSSTRLTVYRRFSHFVILHTALTRRLPGIALPPLPEKQYAGRFSEEFVEARRGDLERYINRVVRHPIARYAEVMTFFLGCESDAVWGLLRRFWSCILIMSCIGMGQTTSHAPWLPSSRPCVLFTRFPPCF